MSLSLVKKGTWNEIYEVSDQLLAILGKIVEKNRKGQIMDIASGSYVTITDKFIRREHQYRPDMGPKRLRLVEKSNPPGASINVAISPKVDVSDCLTDPYFVIESQLAGEKVLVYEREGIDALGEHISRLIKVSEDKYASENKGELKSDVLLEFVIPRLSISLKATKPHRIDRHNLETQSDVNFVTEALVGARIIGRLVRGVVEEQPANSAKPENPEKSGKSKKSKKSKISSTLPPPVYSWEVKNSIGCGNLFRPQLNQPISAIVAALGPISDSVRMTPSAWGCLWVRTTTAGEFLSSIPDNEEYPLLLHCGRLTLKGMIGEFCNHPGIINFLKTSDGCLINFGFTSRARSVALLREAERVGDEITRNFSLDQSQTAYLGLRGWIAGVTCSNGHLAVSTLMTDSSIYAKMHWKRCDRCQEERSQIYYDCGVCDETGVLCGLCSLGGLLFCPSKHALLVHKEKHGILCDSCNNDRTAIIECPLAHLKKSLCDLCLCKDHYSTLKRSLEPSPFEHCLAVIGRVKLNHASDLDALKFSQETLYNWLRVDPSDNALTVSEIFANSEGYAEFRFTLLRTSIDQISPYRRVLDAMLKGLENSEAVIDIVELDTIPVANPKDASNEISLHHWIHRLDKHP